MSMAWKQGLAPCYEPDYADLWWLIEPSVEEKMSEKENKASP